MLKGPPNFSAWLESWRVFRCAVILLNGCLPAPLDDYANLIQRLAERYPWGMVSQADERMRSDQWERIRRDQEERVSKNMMLEPFNQNKPWESVIRQSVSEYSYWNEKVRFAAQASSASVAFPPSAPIASAVQPGARSKAHAISKAMVKEGRGPMVDTCVIREGSCALHGSAARRVVSRRDLGLRGALTFVNGAFPFIVLWHSFGLSA
eukprot:668973-Amphidinium_carterae.3